MPGREGKGTRCLDVAAAGSAVWGDRRRSRCGEWGVGRGRRRSAEAMVHSLGLADFIASVRWSRPQTLAAG